MKVTHREFQEAIAGNRVLAMRCGCGAYAAPPIETCRECGSADFSAVELSGKGKVKTCTTVFTAPEGFAAPYVVALVELEEGPWLVGNIQESSPETDESLIGREVIVSHTVWKGDRYSGGEKAAIAFRLVDTQAGERCNNDA